MPISTDHLHLHRALESCRAHAPMCIRKTFVMWQLVGVTGSVRRFYNRVVFNIKKKHTERVNAYHIYIYIVQNLFGADFSIVLLYEIYSFASLRTF